MNQPYNKKPNRCTNFPFLIECTPGKYGVNCSQVCPNGFFGRLCEKKCPLECNETCDKISGDCPGKNHFFIKICILEQQIYEF